MKISIVDYKNVLIIVEDYLSEVSQVFGISFVIEVESNIHLVLIQNKD